MKPTDWNRPDTWRVIVTGGASGLGAATCRALTQIGAAVMVLDRQEADACSTVVVDLAESGDAEHATTQAIAHLGGLDAVVCCAGVDAPGPLTTTAARTWDRIVAVNLLATAAVVRAALPTLEQRSGRLVTVASTLGHRAVGDATAYCASKFGVVGFTRALTAELRGRVGVTLVTPGGMRTAFFDDRDEQYRPGPDAELADPATIADAIVWTLGRPRGIEVRELAIMASGEPSWP